MTISVFLDPSQMPNQSQDQTTFDNNMGGLIQTLPTFAQQVNDTAGQINSAVAGGAYALPYVFDSGTADADPGPGKLRLSSATQNAATVLRLDVLAGGQDVTSILDQFDASTSGVKGSIRLVKIGDPSKWLTFDVTARAAPSGYRNLTVVNTGGSSASPFAAPDGLLLFFQRNGDKGSAGDLLTPTLYVREEQASGVNASNYANNATRFLNAVITNTISGASVSASTITLPPGTYDIEGNAPIYGQDVKHRVHLLNAITAAKLALGTTENSYYGTSRSYVRGRLTFAASIQLVLAQVVGVGGAVSGGLAINAGVNEVYAELMIRKVA